MDITGDGLGTTVFTAPAFLSQIPLMTTDSKALFPQGELWPIMMTRCAQATTR